MAYHPAPDSPLSPPMFLFSCRSDWPMDLIEFILSAVGRLVLRSVPSGPIGEWGIGEWLWLAGLCLISWALIELIHRTVRQR